jgi:predicted nuclease of predicted toxin-antitoxin system
MPNEHEGLFVSLYTDADVHGRLAGLIRKQGYSARSTVEEGNDDLSDEDQLEFASARNRAILSHNYKDFAPLHRKWQREGKHHSGIILSPQLALGELLRRTLRLLNYFTADEMRDSLVHLSNFADHKQDR